MKTEKLPCGCTIYIGLSCRYHRGGSDLSATGRKSLQNNKRKTARNKQPHKREPHTDEYGYES